ncbi:uncharacterized protein LOC130667513 [Microplitis mediator]|uniref:uncharacterized protein LOC130667513 n=1 Tax=Microplitis mediator TaxID=375433 RepID=UPI002554BE68|nr:uncharacterized protein LOC130667513 [Microplitis mediator]
MLFLESHQHFIFILSIFAVIYSTYSKNNSRYISRLKRELDHDENSEYSADKNSDISLPSRRANINKNININNNKNVFVKTGNFFQIERDKLNYDSLHSNPLKNTLEKLRAADIIRDNVIFIMGYMLQLSPGTLSIEEYTSLELISNAIKRKNVYLYDTLHIVTEINGKHILKQLLEFLKAAKKNFAFFIKSSVEFWIRLLETRDNKIIWKQMDQDTFNLVAGVFKQTVQLIDRDNNNEDISKKLWNLLSHEGKNELIKYDVTNEIMGPVYVALFYGITSKRIPLTQQLFGTILRDLPNEDADPIFDEYVSYISREIWKNKIKKWGNYFSNIKAYNPYTLVINVVDKISADTEVPFKFKKSLLYVRDHLITGGRGIINHEIENSYRITENGLNVNLLFELTISCDCNNRIIDMKNELQKYLTSNLDDDIFMGINRYKYNNPHDLMLGFLSRLQMRLSSTKYDKKILRIISILLSYLFYQRNLHYYQKFKSNISFWIIIDIIDNPNANSTISQTIESILTDIMSDLKSWDRIENLVIKPLITTEKNYLECKTLDMLTELKDVVEDKHVFPSLPAKITKLIADVKAEFNDDDSDMDGSDQQDGGSPEKNMAADHNSRESKPPVPKSPSILGSLRPLMNFENLSPISAMKSIFKNSIKPNLKRIRRIQSRIDLPDASSLESLSKVTQFAPHESLAEVGVTKPALAISMKPSNSMTSSVNKPFATKLLDLPSISALSKNLSTLPPAVQPNECIVITTNVGELKILPTVFTRSNDLTDDPDTIVFPTMVDLHDQPDYDLFEHASGQCVQNLKKLVIQPLVNLFGDKYIEILLGRHWSRRYSTRLAALVALIRSARKHQQVAENYKLMENLDNVLGSLEIIAPYLFLPMLIRWKNFDGKIVWSTVSIDDLSVSILGRDPPDYEEKGTITLPLINPLYWLLPIEQQPDPYLNLLPHFTEDNKYALGMKPLVDVFKLKEITSLIGRDIKLSRFPNRGALLVWTLFELMNVKKVRMDAELYELVKMYWKAIQQPTFTIKIPRDTILGETRERYGNWAVDLIGLMEALPKPTDNQQENLWIALRNYLSRSNLLEELNILLPRLTTTRGRFLHNIIIRSLMNNNNRIKIEHNTKSALLFYRDKVMFDGEGAKHVGWIWSQKFTADMLIGDYSDNDVHVGKLIEQHLPYYKLTRDKQKAYNNLVEYLYMNPHMLDLKDDFMINKYNTTGMFIRGVLEYIYEKSGLNPRIQKDILMLIPEVIVNGREQ